MVRASGRRGSRDSYGGVNMGRSRGKGKGKCGSEQGQVKEYGQW